MLIRYALPLLFATPTLAQYCTPTFANGCFSWHSQSIVLGGTEWFYDGDCSFSDHTDIVLSAQAGVPASMQVTSGNWTGCAVWVDLNNDQDFAESEVMYYNYVGGDPGYTYDFTITVPETTPTGSYYLRVISAWGSDGFSSTNTNGYGPCGEFQYGNFDDFLLDVANTSGTEEAAERWVAIGPNPTDGMLTLINEVPLASLSIWSSEGRLMERLRPTGFRQAIDLGSYPAGMYRIQCAGLEGVRNIPVLKY